MQVAIDAPAYIVVMDASENRSYKPRTGRWYLAEVMVELPGNPEGLAMLEDPMAAMLYDTEREALANAKRVGGYVLEVVAAGGRI